MVHLLNKPLVDMLSVLVSRISIIINGFRFMQLRLGDRVPEMSSEGTMVLTACSIFREIQLNMLSSLFVDPNFDSDHFSAWGRQLKQDADLIRDMVATYNPDYLLVLLGFNDMGWFVSDAEGTFESMKLFISEARAAKPDIKMALGNVPQRRYMNCRDDLPIKTNLYNKMLAAAIPQWSMYISLVSLAIIRDSVLLLRYHPLDNSHFSEDLKAEIVDCYPPSMTL
jgi:hypothetical protein